MKKILIATIFILALVPVSTTIAATGAFHIVSISGSDPFFTTDATQPDLQWYLAKIGIPQAWEYSTGSKKVIVAIVDTGIHASHIELNDGRVIGGFNSITNELIPANADSDDNGHGTAVAGIIGAITNNQHGISGINWDVSLMPIKAVGADGTGDLSAVANGIIWAADHGANIINLSLGGSTFGQDNILTSAISYAYNHDVLIVAAAGNDSQQQGINLDREPVFPVCDDNGHNMILGVAATDINDVKAGFSDYGSGCIDISAPGQRILTTAFLPDNPSNNVLIYGSGTSLATPIVSGVAALIKAANPRITNAELHRRLVQTADNIYPLNQTACAGGSCNGLLGSGRINALAALAPQPLTDGSLVQETSTGNIYQISQGAKRLVTDFVFKQRGFLMENVIHEFNGQLATIPTQSALPPLEGTLLKTPNDPTVYVATGDLIRPLTYLVFSSRAFSFANVQIISDNDFSFLVQGDWYWPPEGTLVLVNGDPTVYVMDHQVRRPVTYSTFIQRHLSFANVIRVSQSDFLHVPMAPDNYWLAPLDGTLIKTSADPTVYLIDGEAKHALSYETFTARHYNLRNIKILPPVEMDVIAPGGAL